MPLRNGRRGGTFQSFIEPIRNRPSLTIYKFATVNKVNHFLYACIVYYTSFHLTIIGIGIEVEILLLIFLTINKILVKFNLP